MSKGVPKLSVLAEARIALKQKQNLTPAQKARAQQEAIIEQVEKLRGGPLSSEEVASEFDLPLDKAQEKVTRISRRHLDRMIMRFSKNGPGAPRGEAIRADEPLDRIIEDYEWYQAKCVRMASRWNDMAKTCTEQLRKLRKKRPVK